MKLLALAGLRYFARLDLDHRRRVLEAPHARPDQTGVEAQLQGITVPGGLGDVERHWQERSDVVALAPEDEGVDGDGELEPPSSTGAQLQPAEIKRVTRYGHTAELSGGNFAFEPLLRRMSNWFRSYGFADVFDGLLIGAYPLDQDDVAMLEWMRVERILNLVEDSEYRPGEREEAGAALAAAGIEEHRLSLTDYGELPPDALEDAVQQVLTWLDERKRVYVHCRAGWQRSAAVAAGVIAVRDGVDVDAALALVQVRKPRADPLPHQREDLRRWWDAREDAGDRRPSRPPGADER